MNFSTVIPMTENMTLNAVSTYNTTGFQTNTTEADVLHDSDNHEKEVGRMINVVCRPILVLLGR